MASTRPNHRAGFLLFANKQQYQFFLAWHELVMAVFPRAPLFVCGNAYHDATLLNDKCVIVRQKKVINNNGMSYLCDDKVTCS